MTRSTELVACGKHAKAHMAKADQYGEKQEKHLKSAGKYLVEAHQLCEKEKVPFKQFLIEHEIGRSRAYEVIAIVGGVPSVKKKTEEEVKASRQERQTNQRDRNRKASVADGHGVDPATNERAQKVREEIQQIGKRDKAIIKIINWVKRQEMETLEQLIKDYSI